MQPQKKFVRYNNFNDKEAYHRQSKKNYYRKSYTEKSLRPREAVKELTDLYSPLDEIPEVVAKLIQNYPKFFSGKSKAPEKDNNFSLNEYIAYAKKKHKEGFHQNKKMQEPHSSSDPDWNTDDEVDGNMESKRIDNQVIAKVQQKLGDTLVKKQDILKRHEKQFLEDYFRLKRLQRHQKEQSQGEADSKSEVKDIEKTAKIEQKDNQNKGNVQVSSKLDKVQISWSQYQQKQVSTFVDRGFITKIDEDDDEIQAQLVEDNDAFKEDEAEKSEEEKNSDQDDQDDIFGDEQATKITKRVQNKKEEEEQKPTQGVVYINSNIFSKIAESVGLLPSQCVWVITDSISDFKNRFRVPTHYMDEIYNKQRLNELCPLISLNHSEFVRKEEVETAGALEIFRKFNARKKWRPNQNQRQNGKGGKDYATKYNSHLKIK